MRPLKLPLVALLVILSLLAGCLSHDAQPTAPTTAADRSAKDAGAATGNAPAAPHEPYQVKAASSDGSAEPIVAKAYPVKIHTNAAKPPVHKEISGTYNLTECTSVGNLNPLQSGWRMAALSDAVAPGDVFTYALNLTWENSDNSWADLHLYYGLGAKNQYWDQPTADKRGLVFENFTGQGYRVADKDPAWAAVSCWYGGVTSPISYKLTVDLTFAQDAVPAETPFLLTVPAGASQLFVTAVPYDAAKGVLSHFRVFGPDDRLVCECALSPLHQATSVRLTAGPGDYVVLVDHSTGGFVSLALDAPPTDSLRPLHTTWKVVPLASSDLDQAVDKTIDINIPTVPLVLGAFAWPSGADSNVAGGKALSIMVKNPRGTPLSLKWAGFVSTRVATPATWDFEMFGVPVPGGEWEYKTDHHSYANGPQKVRVTAEWLRGEALLEYLTYERT